MENLIYSKHYEEPFLLDDAGEEEACCESEGCGLSEADDELRRFFSECRRIEFIPDPNGIKKAKELVRKVRQYSEKHTVSADVYRHPATVCCMLYFYTDILSGERKTALAELIRLADEVTAVPHPKKMEQYELAVMLNCVTHRRFLDGREIEPF